MQLFKAKDQWKEKFLLKLHGVATGNFSLLLDVPIFIVYWNGIPDNWKRAKRQSRGTAG